MKRSLPVLLGLGVVILIVGLVAGGFLDLPSIRSDEADANVPHSPAPRKNPDAIAVDTEDHERLSKKKENRKKDSKRDRKRKRKGERSDDRKKAARKPTKGTPGTRTPPKIRKRNGDRQQDRPKRDRNGGRDKNPAPPDPAPVTVSDLRGDPEGEGEAPNYMDFESVRLEATGDIFVVDLTFAGNIPAKLPKGNAMVASIEVDRGDRKVSAWAEGAENGWDAYTNSKAEAPASMSISGRTMRFTVPRSFFGERFGFYAHTSWTKSTLTKTDYFFDFAPDDGNGRFPSGGTT